jgi:hypothetical protein
MGLKRSGIESGTFKNGDEVILKGNPRRDFAESGVVNFRVCDAPG